MTTDNNSSNLSETLKQADEPQSDIQFSDIVAWTFSHKLFILLSVFLCLVLGMAYIYRSQPVYQRTSSVMIRSDSQGNSAIGELAAFSDLGMFSTGIDVYNEIEAFKSPILMEEIVRRLDLNVQYLSKNWIGRTTDWYGESPIKAEFSDIIRKYDSKPVDRFSFKVSLNADSTTVSLSDFTINGEDIDTEPIQTGLKQATATPSGKVTVSPTLFFKENFKQPITVIYTTVPLCAKDNLKLLTTTLADKKSTVINFGYTDTSAKRAEDVLNTLLDVYNEDWIRYMNESTMNTSKFINDRLVVIEKELGAVDSDIEKFKSANKLLDITAETKQVTEESSKYSDQAFMAMNQLSIAKYILEYMVDQTKAFELLPANSGIESSNLELQIAEYNKLLLDRQRLISNSSDENPLVSDLNSQLTMMRSTIRRSVENLISTLQIQVDRIAAQEDEIAGKITASPGKVRELLSIERQQKIKEELYLYLLQKREANELSASVVVNNTRLLAPANGESIPVSPKKLIIMAVAFFLGLAIPYGYMYMTSILNTTVRGRKDIEWLSAPIAGEIPQESKPQRYTKFRKMLNRDKSDSKPPRIVVKPGSRDVINEAYRVVRTNLDFILSGNDGTPVIMVTSYNPGSGKTFTTLNLAASISLKGKKVAVVDLDIRKGTFSKCVNSPRKGVATYLNAQSDLDSIMVKNALGTGLDIIPVGTLPPNPAELLLSDRLEELAKELKARYDYVFLDCPPIDIVADTSIISRIANRTLFIIRVGVMDRRILPDIEEIYQAKRCPNMAVILNGCKQAAGYGYNRYSYGYGRYGYGNEYAQNADKE